MKFVVYRANLYTLVKKYLSVLIGENIKLNVKQ